MCKVSVIIPVFNGKKYLKGALDSAFGQTYTDYEITIINDGSTDLTETVIMEYLSLYPDKIKYISMANKGLAAARNVGISNSRGEYIALLDADDIWLAERLSETVSALDQMPRVGIVHANVSLIDARGEFLETPQRRRNNLSGKIANKIALWRAHIACPTVLFRRECLDKAGLFDENLSRLGCEDRDLWIRIASLYEVYYIDRVLALYRITESGMSSNRAKMLQARRYVIDKHFPADDPSMRKRVLRRLALSRVYRDRADDSLLASDYPSARRDYLQSIWWCPISLWPWINYVKTFFPGLLHRKP